jgi:protease IV
MYAQLQALPLRLLHQGAEWFQWKFCFTIEPYQERHCNEGAVNTNSSNHQFVAIGLLALCLIAVILGVIQIAKLPSGANAVGSQDAMPGTFLGGSGDRLAYIPLEGMIMEDSENGSILSPESSAVKARKLLYFAAKDPSVKGVLLRMNSPGGTVGMSQELYAAVQTVRKEKPVVVSMGDLAASGAYYTAAAADKIVANPGTLTASIGVILETMNVEGFLTGKLGVKHLTIKSGHFKDILSPFRPTRPDEVALIQHIIDTSYRQFLNAVLEGRTHGMKDGKLKQERIESITAVADGRIVIGEDAVKIGLVDSLGGIEEAKQILQELSAKRFHISNPKKLTLQEYENTFNLFDLLGIGASVNFKPQAAQVIPSPREMLPVTLRYANQPLWMMETYR